MNGARLVNIEMLYLLWAIPVLAGVLAYAARRRKRALLRFAEAGLLREINTTASSSRRFGKAVILMAAFALAVVALARPAWNPVEEKVERRGRDVVFVLDVSRSMLAEDLAPNRLERAKLAIQDGLERMQGDRAALVVFAGNAVVKCPLTHDYGFLRMALEDVSPESVSRGGTLIGDAIRTVMSQLFDNQARGFRDVVLITDGEDQESYPVEAAEQLGKLDVRLIAVGLGDENQGQRIPVTGQDGQRRFLTYEGQEVWSRLDAQTLRRMVDATPGGRYLNVATGAIDFGDVYLSLISGAGRTELGTETLRLYEEKFQIFLTLAFLLLCLEVVLPERRPEVEIS